MKSFAHYRAVACALVCAALTATAQAEFSVSQLHPVVLGDAKEAPDLGKTGPDGAYVLTGSGRESNMGRDEASFAGLETDALNFTFIARVASTDGVSPIPKYGIAARAGREGIDKAVQLRYDAYERHKCLQWFMRYHIAPGDPDGGRRAYFSDISKDFANPTGVWMKLVRRYPYVQTYASADGTTWTEVGADYLKALLPQKVWVGLQVTAGDPKARFAVTYDHISFTADAADASPDTPATYKEYCPPVPPHRLIAALYPDRDNIRYSTFLLLPKGADPAKIRAILWSSGSKEFTVNGKPYPDYDYREKELGFYCVPKQLPTGEGEVEVTGLDPNYLMYQHYGLVRMGGFFPPEHFQKAVNRLSEVSGIPALKNIPFVVTGSSFAGGYAVGGAATFPDKTVAAAPVMIGMAGSDTQDRKVLNTPHLNIYGSIDTTHLKVALATTPQLHEKHALWANAPQWVVAHNHYKANALIYPYFLDVLDLRLPANRDYAKGPPTLNTLREEDGWYGFPDSWNANAPEIVRVKDYKGDSKMLVWLPTEHSARVWQAFVSNNPRTLILFPSFDGSSTFGGPQPYDYHNSNMEAGVPWELVATGPRGKDLTVEYYAGLKKLAVVKTHDGNPYRVTLEGLPVGLHAIHAVTTVDGVKEISRPVTIMFHERAK